MISVSYLIPRQTSFADAVLLALVSKSIVLAEAIVLLVANGFQDEAFGLCRTCLELELTVRYLTNADTLSRCERYARYFSKVNEGWVKITKKHYPDMSLTVRADAAELAELASNYKDPHRWSEHNLKYFASEPDSFEKRDDGTPMDQPFYYQALYKWMSYYVHAAEPALDPFHITVPSDTFRFIQGRDALLVVRTLCVCPTSSFTSLCSACCGISTWIIPLYSRASTSRFFRIT